MKMLISAFATATAQMLVVCAFAQTPPTDKAAVRAERKAAGAEAARNFLPGEGNPKPDSRVKPNAAQRAAAKSDRKREGSEAARTFQPGEGDPKPLASAKIPRAERSAAHKARRADLADGGPLPSYGDNYGGK